MCGVEWQVRPVQHPQEEEVADRSLCRGDALALKVHWAAQRRRGRRHDGDGTARRGGLIGKDGLDPGARSEDEEEWRVADPADVHRVRPERFQQRRGRAELAPRHAIGRADKHAGGFDQGARIALLARHIEACDWGLGGRRAGGGRQTRCRAHEEQAAAVRPPILVVHGNADQPTARAGSASRRATRSRTSGRRSRP